MGTSLNQKKIEWRRKRNEENKIQRLLMLHKRLEENKKKYPQLYRIVDSALFRSFYRDKTGKDWREELGLDVVTCAMTITTMSQVHPDFPEFN